MPPATFVIRHSTFVIFLLLLAGCSNSFLAHQIVDAPNGGFNQKRLANTTDTPGPALLGVDHQFSVPVQDAAIAVWILDPAATPRGTILVLHGIDDEKFWMLDQAQSLQKAGYRAVLVDLRGHGDSTGKFITFGVQESQDLSTVLDDLTRRHLLTGSVGVYGMSYGAALAIEFAGHDPRVSAVVAVAPFATMRDEVPNYTHTMLPPVDWCLSPKDYTNIINEAGRLASFNPDDASPLKAITQTSAQILLIHGKVDMIIPIQQSQLLHAAAKDHSRLVEVPNIGHVLAWVDADGHIAAETTAWFNQYLRGKIVSLASR